MPSWHENLHTIRAIDAIYMRYILVCMKTKIIFNTDTKLKIAAQKKARQQGLTLTGFLNLATRAYVKNEIEVDIIGRDISRARQSKGIPAEEVYRRLDIKM